MSCSADGLLDGPSVADVRSGGASECCQSQRVGVGGVIGCALRPDRGVHRAQAKMVETGPQRANALEQQLAALQFDDRGHRRPRSSVPFDLKRPILSPVLTAAVRAGDGADPKLRNTTSSSRRSAREESTRAAILAYVAEHPGCTTNQITAVITGRREDVLAARDALIEEIALLTVKGANRALLHYTNSSGSQHTGTTGNHRPVDTPPSGSTPTVLGGNHL